MILQVRLLKPVTMCLLFRLQRLRGCPDRTKHQVTHGVYLSSRHQSSRILSKINCPLSSPGSLLWGGKMLNRYSLLCSWLLTSYPLPIIRLHFNSGFCQILSYKNIFHTHHLFHLQTETVLHYSTWFSQSWEEGIIQMVLQINELKSSNLTEATMIVKEWCWIGTWLLQIQKFYLFNDC